MTMREFFYRFMCAAIAAVPVWIISINTHCNAVVKTSLISSTMLITFIVIDAIDDIHFWYLRRKRIKLKNNNVHDITIEFNKEVYNEYIDELKHLYEDYSFLMKD